MILFELITFGDYCEYIKGRNLITRTKDNKLIEFGIDVYDINHPKCIGYGYTKPEINICDPFDTSYDYGIPVYEAGPVHI